MPQKTVTPSETDIQRIKQDISIVKKARSLISDQDDFTSGFKQPANGPITGVYGSQRFYNGVPKVPIMVLTMPRQQAPRLLHLRQA